MTAEQYAADHGITLRIVSRDGYQVDANRWEHYAFTVRLVRADGEASPKIKWRQGTGHGDADPTAGDVLEASVSDAHAFTDAGSFREFAESFGYDPDSRKAERIYKACGKVAGWLPAFVDADDFSATTD